MLDNQTPTPPDSRLDEIRQRLGLQKGGGDE